jgi:CMP-2-keto-3-deoxyoctulosonic acid synthetase
MPASGLQKAEDLEQNKVIEAGFKIKVGKVEDAVHGVDTPEQLDELNALIRTGKFPHMQLPSLSHVQV